MQCDPLDDLPHLIGLLNPGLEIRPVRFVHEHKTTLERFLLVCFSFISKTPFFPIAPVARVGASQSGARSGSVEEHAYPKSDPVCLV
jgi:hypothetical protein